MKVAEFLYFFTFYVFLFGFFWNLVEEFARKSQSEAQYGHSAAIWMYYVFNERFEDAEKFLASFADPSVVLKECNVIHLCMEFKNGEKEEGLRYFLRKNYFSQRRMFYSYLIGLQSNFFYFST